MLLNITKIIICTYTYGYKSNSFNFSLQKISVCSDDISIIMTSFIEDLSQLNVKQGITNLETFIFAEYNILFKEQSNLKTLLAVYHEPPRSCQYHSEPVLWSNYFGILSKRKLRLFRGKG